MWMLGIESGFLQEQQVILTAQLPYFLRHGFSPYVEFTSRLGWLYNELQESPSLYSLSLSLGSELVVPYTCTTSTLPTDPSPLNHHCA